MSSGGALLGQVQLKFQLLMSSDSSMMKGNIAKETNVIHHTMASSSPEKGGSSMPLECVVGTGSSHRKKTRTQRARTLSPHPSYLVAPDERRSTLPTVRWNILKSGSKSSPPPYSDAVEWKGKERKVPDFSSAQLSVMEDLTEKGNKLRGRMIQSLLMDGHRMEEEEVVMTR